MSVWVEDSGKIRVAAEKSRTSPALRKKTGLCMSNPSTATLSCPTS